MKKTILFLTVLLLTVTYAHAQELTVCSYNVRNKNSGDTNAGNGWNTRRTYLINFVNFQHPDLLGVQEAMPAQMTDLSNGMKDYARIGVGRDDGANSGEFSAIFYCKESMVLLDNGDFWLSDTPYKPSKGFPSVGGSTSYKRICTWGKFYHKASGTVIYHFNTHMDLDETNRQQSFYLIKQKIQEIASLSDPVIISGDYNAVQTGGAYKLFYNSGFLYDCFQRTRQKFITNGTSPGFDAGNYSTVSGELRRIDHIFVTRAFNIERYGVPNPCYYSTSGTATYYERAYSDHSPVIVRLSVKNPEMKELTTTPPPIVDGVYQISSAQDLQAFSYIVSGIAGYTQNASAKAILLNDIDMTDMDSWLPIGTSGTPFRGTFDGQGHSVKNIRIKTGKGYSGLFGSTSGATIRNFHVSGTITVSEGSTEHGTVGYASATTITDVHSELNITVSQPCADTKHIGGIAGSLADGSTINRCSYGGKLSDAGTNTIGGIAGYADQTANSISNCINHGTVSTKGSTTNTGGILGYVNHADFRISHCVNVGSVSGDPAYAGQILGRQVKAMTTVPSHLYYLQGESNLTAFGSDTDAKSAVGATAVSAERMASGEVCYKLNGGQTEISWFQTLQEDLFPVLDATHKVVLYSEAEGYYNEGGSDKGDLNGDGTVDIADAVTVLNAMATTPSDQTFDVNADGKVDVADFVTILNLMALNPHPSPLTPHPSTLTPHPSPLNPQPSTLNPQPSTLSPQDLYIGSFYVTSPEEEELYGNGGDKWTDRLPVICDMFNFEHPDVLGLQSLTEVQLDKIKLRMTDYSTAGDILYDKNTLQLDSCGIVDGMPEGSTCSWAKLEKGGTAFYVFNICFSTDTSVATLSASTIRNAVGEINTENLPCFVVGFLGVNESKTAYTRIITKFNDCYTKSPIVSAEYGTKNNFDLAANHSSERYDFVFASRNVTTRAYGQLQYGYYTQETNGSYKRRLPSTHFPVMAKVTLPPLHD